MSIEDIKRAKVLREYGERIGRKGIAERVKDIAAQIMKGEDEYQSTMIHAGEIAALVTAAGSDTYWGEKTGRGKIEMFYEAKKYLIDNPKVVA